MKITVVRFKRYDTGEWERGFEIGTTIVAADGAVVLFCECQDFEPLADLDIDKLVRV